MRGAILRALAAAFALSWLVLPGFGLIDLSVSWNPDWPQVLEAGWGLYFTVLVGGAFALVAARPRTSTPAVVQLFVAAGALAVSAIVAHELRLLAFSGAVALEAVIVMGVPGRVPAGPLRGSRSLLVLAGLGIVPCVVYSLRMYEFDREGRPDGDISVGIDHYSVQGALGLAVAILAVLVAVWPSGRRFTGCCTGIAAAYLGLVSLAWPDAAGGFSRPWSAAAIVWGAAVVTASLAGSQATAAPTPL